MLGGPLSVMKVWLMPANDKSTQDYFGLAIILSDTHICPILNDFFRHSGRGIPWNSLTILTKPTIFAGGFESEPTSHLELRQNEPERNGSTESH